MTNYERTLKKSIGIMILLGGLLGFAGRFLPAPTSVDCPAEPKPGKAVVCHQKKDKS